MTRRKDLGKQKGFTLIELLIVVGIIALLVSILMPALRAAKERSKRILCTSQLHQMGVVFTQYAQDFNDFFPIFNYNNNGFMFYYVPDDMMMWLGDGFGSEIFPQLAPGHYGLPHEVFYCPSIRPNRYHGDMVNDWWWYKPTDGQPTRVANRELEPDTQKGCQLGGVHDWVNLGYGFYIPRRDFCNTGTEHPAGADGNGWRLHPGRDYRAPDRASGRTAPFNPILTDLVLLRRANSTYYVPTIPQMPEIQALFDAHDVKALTGLVGRVKFTALEDRSTHVSNNGLVTQSNALYADGRVVENPGETVVPYYMADWATFW